MEQSDSLSSELNNRCENEPEINMTISEIKKPQKCKSRHLMVGQAKFSYIIPLIVCTGTSVFLDTTGTNMALPFMQEEFSVSESLIQWTLTINYLAQASLSIPIAKLSEKIGQIRMLYILTSIQCALGVAHYFIKNFPLFLVIRFFTGAVQSGSTVCRLSLIRKLSPPGKAQQYLQYQTIVFSVVAMVIPLLAGITIDYDWRLLYPICAILCFLTLLVLIPYSNPESPKQKFKFDYLGCIILFIAIGTLDLAFTVISTYHYIAMGILLLISALFFFIFVKVEKKAQDPVFPLFLMKNPVSDYMIMNVLCLYIQTGFMYFLPQTLTFYGKSSTSAGAVQMVCAVGMIVISAFVPSLSKKVLNKTIMAWSAAFDIIVLLLCVLFAQNMYAFIILCILYQSVFTFFNNILFPLILLSVPPQFSSQMSAVPPTTRTLSQGLTMCAVSMIQQLSYNGLKVGENDKVAWGNALRINISVFVIFQITCLIVLLLRTGHTKAESGKKKFNAQKVRELKVNEEAGILLKEMR
ncbi:Major_facilitator superfamily protein [Hexamita inflata]|uniref:Major_facilitator superfamily protein n=1 Tax=Hexamita inflata TaxID=28002 RepID=A0ABP1GMY9_9EUKA